MAIKVIIEAHSQIVSPAGFSQQYKDGAYLFLDQHQFDQWLSGNPRLRTLGLRSGATILYDYETLSSNLADCYVGRLEYFQ